MEAREIRSNETPSRLNVGGISRRTPRRLDLIEERLRVYDDIFGACDSTYCEPGELTPYIEIYMYRPTTRRPFFTFVTAGMSDLAMHSPAELGARYRRVELVFYAAEGKTEYVELLNHMAHFAHRNATWFHWGRMAANGSRPIPQLQSRTLNCILFMPSPVEPDSRLSENLSWEGDPIQLLWCVPISSAEHSLGQERGVAALRELFRARSHPYIYTDRETYL